MVSQMIIIICCVVFTSLSSRILAETADARHDLYDDLLLDYDNRVLPKKRPNHVVNVTVSVRFLHIHKLSILESEIEASVRLIQKWSDHRLRWKPNVYDGLRAMPIKKHDIWQPDVTLLNSVHQVANNINNIPEFAHLTSNGDITSVSSLTVHASCQPRSENETQICDFRLGSWVYSEKELNVKLDRNKNETNVTVFQSIISSQWVVDQLKSVVERNLVKYECCLDRFSQILVRMYLDRK